MYREFVQGGKGLEHGFFLPFKKNTSAGGGAIIPKVGVNLDLISCAEQLLGYLGFHLSWTELFSTTLSCIQKVNLMHIGKFLKHQETSHHFFFHQALGVLADISRCEITRLWKWNVSLICSRDSVCGCISMDQNIIVLLL